MDPLLVRWNLNCKRFKISDYQTKNAFEEVRDYYQETHRLYHNLNHIKALFKLFDQHKDQLLKPALVAWAIWYHDLIYEIPGNQNEEKSAQIAGLRLRAFGLPGQEASMVENMILASQRHQNLKGNSPDIDWFLDFDLAILGGAWETYQNYAIAVRKEYQLFPDALYIPGRIHAMRQFLERKMIYHTPYFKSHFEASARKNIEQEIALLEKGDFYHHF